MTTTTGPKDTFLNRLLGRIPLTGWLALAAPVAAVVFAGLVTALVLLVTGNPPVETLTTMVEYGTQPRTMVLTLNSATMYYISAIAVALGFRMNLFNIGVDGQYRLAAILAAAVGGSAVLPGFALTVLVIVVAMAVGAAWAAIAGILKATRGVSEVISTIMLNTIASSIVAYLLVNVVGVRRDNNIGTRPIPEDSWVPGVALVPGTQAKVFGLIFLAIALGIGFHVLLNRTRFGFDLRTTGANREAAIASGVNVKRMVVIAMVISGAVAGLAGMPQLLGASYSYSLDFPAGLGFNGIAIALLGRNNPIGVAIGALLWGFLDNSATILDLQEVPPEIVQIMQGVIVLSVVIGYELAHRYRIAAEQRKVSRELAAPAAVEGAKA
ncbi:ABC transporter permease [Thermoactinospora rubra]|uniref:ABC transporter permease n=1 Tax=Thermoactinospora rubra TaxID=1088767 RepID=UPI000A1077A5|nr:ABC transporter permease [Thermoactinospora rubra]